MKKMLLLIPVALAAWFCSSPTNEYPLDLAVHLL